MFDQEFFPTPKKVIKKMLTPYLTKHKDSYGDWVYGMDNITILEPSAGKGDILDYIKETITENWKFKELNLYYIERNMDLQHILREKDYKVIGDDFLTYNGDYWFDLILMNPPFSNGDEHLLKAWELLKGLMRDHQDWKDLTKDMSFDKPQQAYNKFADKLKQEVWHVVLKQTGIQKYMTKSVQENFAQFLEHQGCMDFTKENIASVVQMIFDNRYNILDNAIIEVFDEFTKYHKENRCHVEGWKTNDSWKVNRKVILPYVVKYGEYTSAHDLKMYGSRMDINYNYQRTYADIDKVMCYISGKNYDHITGLYESLAAQLRSFGRIKTGEKFVNTGESEFFRYKFWKKGTMHLEFKDVKLWEEFNIRACLGKNWLPESEKKAWEESKNPKAYQQPTATAGYQQKEQLLLL